MTRQLVHVLRTLCLTFWDYCVLRTQKNLSKFLFWKSVFYEHDGLTICCQKIQYPWEIYILRTQCTVIKNIFFWGHLVDVQQSISGVETWFREQTSTKNRFSCVNYVVLVKHIVKKIDFICKFTNTFQTIPILLLLQNLLCSLASVWQNSGNARLCQFRSWRMFSIIPPKHLLTVFQLYNSLPF